MQKLLVLLMAVAQLSCGRLWSTVTFPGGGGTIAVNLTGSLVAAYSFNEGAGNSTADRSGNGNNANIPTPVWVAGHTGNAISVGFVQINAAIVPNSPSINITSQTITYMAWIFPTGAANTEYTVLGMHGTGGQYNMSANDFNDFNPARPDACFVKITGVYHGVPTTSNLGINSWRHITCVYDGTNLQIYVNGTLNNSTPVTGNLDTDPNSLELGGDSFSGDPFQGDIDDIRIYNRVLTAAEIGVAMLTPVTP